MQQDKTSDFDQTVKKGRGKSNHCFGSRNERFCYTASSKKHGKVGPANYLHTDCFSDKAYHERASRFTFGVSRMSMKKSFIEESMHRSTLGPSPTTYKDGPKFGENGSKALMRGRLTRYG